MQKTVRLSKSRLIDGLQCPKKLYLTIHEPDLAGEVSAGQQLIFDNGHLVGLEAQKRIPGGVVITATHKEHDLALQQTQEAIRAGALAIFEATFEHDGILVKIDILKRESTRHAWEILEVKSSTSVKDVHVKDAAIQLWVARSAGLKVKTVSVTVVNNQCEFPHLEDLFTDTDVTAEADEFLAGLPALVAKLRKLAGASQPPKQEIGPHCADPYDCGFREHCWGAAKVKAPSVFNIPNLREDRKWAYFREGKTKLSALDPEDFNDKQARMIEYTLKNARFVDKPAIAAALKEWNYPLSYLDFETINMPIPRYQGVRAYQPLPFQFSCHIRPAPGGKRRQVEYLHTEDTDPREAIGKALCAGVPADGSIVAFSKGTEGGILKKLAEEFPKLRKQLLSMADRLVDPLPLFRNFVYDPAFQGSFSIKDVAPALLGKAASYEGMAVGDGTAAQAAYLAMLAATTPARERGRLRESLVTYCTKDTHGMVLLVDWLYQQAGLR